MSVLVYISHPYGGKAENKQKIGEIVKTLAVLHKDTVFLSPVHASGFLYDCLDYDHGMKYCLKLLGFCDEMWVFGCWQESRGCKREVAFCDKHDIPYQIVGDKPWHKIQKITND